MTTRKQPQAESPIRASRACDICRKRKVKCHRDVGSTTCDGCSALGLRCTQNAPRRKRGRPNAYAPNVEATRPSQPPGLNISSSASSGTWQDRSLSCSPLNSTPFKGSTILAALGTAALLQQVLDDWFNFIHPLLPLLHRRWFLSRILQGEADRNPVFLGLVLSVYAVTAMTFRQNASEAYEGITASRCLRLIQDHNLLATDNCTLDWCIAKHNIAWALGMEGRGCLDFRVFHAIKDSIAGLQWLIVHRLDEMSLHDREFSKRLYCILMSMDLGANTRAQSYLNLHSIDEPFTRMLPHPTTDIALDPSLSISVELNPTAEDDVDYVSGLLASFNIFLSWWHAKQDKTHKSTDETLRRGIDHIQHVLDDLPPKLRWRGALSRDPRTTPGHEAQIMDILIRSLFMKSNFLQHFASSNLPHPTHETIISDVVEILKHFPKPAMYANRHRIAVMARDIGAAYMEEMKNIPRTSNQTAETADNILKQLLQQLECLEGLERPRTRRKE